MNLQRSFDGWQNNTKNGIVLPKFPIAHPYTIYLFSLKSYYICNMENRTSIPSGYTTAQVAERLGISQHEVARHIRNGSLSAILTNAGIYIIDPDSAHRFENNIRKKGRPWDAETSWAALLLLDGATETELSYHRERRLRIKLADISVEQFISMSRKRMRVMRFSVSPSFIKDLLESLSITGATSTHVIELGLAVNSERVIDGYSHKPINEIATELFLIPDGNGNCTLREPIGLPQKLQGLSEMPPAVVAADLATSIDNRERRCGLDYLERKLVEFRKF